MTVSKFRKCRFGGLVESARMPSIDAASFARLQADKKLAPVFKLKRVRYVMEAAEVLTRTSDLWLTPKFLSNILELLHIRDESGMQIVVYPLLYFVLCGLVPSYVIMFNPPRVQADVVGWAKLCSSNPPSLSYLADAGSIVVGVIIPAYNETYRLPYMLETILDYLNSLLPSPRHTYRGSSLATTTQKITHSRLH
ncbi:uncharacterized protein EDB93DRAFT_1107214 [Suillus bovinus]|uniref:uncharacterized protein n=1 Tax=Suillus bovinus TaxID=48563 RepID=UPI001B87F4FC|nr:uncharacterized protein EDB93DRAFT_1107214 [Suillus bovinus]KAG2134879.1 hypothetical protein EDB93DRAFT_1107214 [Suillus bovinus]